MQVHEQLLVNNENNVCRIVGSKYFITTLGLSYVHKICARHLLGEVFHIGDIHAHWRLRRVEYKSNLPYVHLEVKKILKAWI